MDEFADDTGVSGKAKPKRYLWTDAYAVCNFLELYRQTGLDRYRMYGKELVDQVHHVLGRHRDDDPRRGWISGLSESEGEKHPTCGGLRIGKKLNERKPNEPSDPQLEWDQDGQYFHYLTKWMHALSRLSRETGDGRYGTWAVELAATAHKAFVRQIYPGGPKQIVWKMSIDLSWPLVSSMGQHDALDGLITFLELQSIAAVADGLRHDLRFAIDEMNEMCAHGRWATEDPLGIGGLLDNANRLAQMIVESNLPRHELFRKLLGEAAVSLNIFSRSTLLMRPANHRLPFRELGLSIGIQGLRQIRNLIARDSTVAAICNHLLLYLPLAQQIQEFWALPEHRRCSTWNDHREINAVMLATSLMSEV